MKDKVVVITGASAGIGACLAELASHRGAKVVLAARREKQLEEVAARCGPHAFFVVADVTARQDVRRVCQAAMQQFGQVDVWVNNAGRGITRPVSELTDEDFDEMMSVNVKSALFTFRPSILGSSRRSSASMPSTEASTRGSCRAPSRPRTWPP